LSHRIDAHVDEDEVDEELSSSATQLSEEIDDEREDGNLKKNEWNVEQSSGNDDCRGTIKG
jgi:hypothetical protein